MDFDVVLIAVSLIATVISLSDGGTIGLFLHASKKQNCPGQPYSRITWFREMLTRCEEGREQC